MQLDKLDKYTCLKESGVVIPTEGEEESSSDEGDEDNSEDDDTDDEIKASEDAHGSEFSATTVANEDEALAGVKTEESPDEKVTIRKYLLTLA